ncbi:PREDICTED: trihelix transcription factor GT-2-like [Ipomoea nil]|uniref:trihelix transcription factor GT-2-like n=1 Tax=Ipomoea nil TaxID=35883 RepID=UPI000901FBEA|nr:PREDICTED: trihelix transcription factor GT-2-like [Ipomoea nil]
MLGDPGQMMSSSGGGGTTGAAAAESGSAAAAASNSGGSSGTGALPGGFGEESERNSGGNRWPRQETLALLKIRSDMDAVFRDSSLKGPLWEEVSRKMAELGYHRSSKKCKEKFENVFKYHKRTKEGRAAKSDGKTYRFFDQLQAFHTPSQAAAAAQPMVVTAPAGNPPRPVTAALPQFTVSSVQNTSSAFPAPLRAAFAPIPAANNAAFPAGTGNALSYSTSSSTSSDEDIQRRHRKKRKWKEFFERVMGDVIAKQEEMQRKFLEALEKRERDRTVREDAWRAQETARIKRERDILLQERSMAAAKDAAVINLLQKLSDQNNTVQIPSITNNSSDPIIQIQVQIPETLSTPPLAPPPPLPQPQEPSPISVAPPASMPFSIQTPTPEKNAAAGGGGGESFTTAPPSSSRWPKAEVQALIDLRSSLDVKYQENTPKGPLWEDISAAMRRLGYNRNPKRCKEKWENINKYFKKVKENNKKRPEDSKTCPYFHQLEALYSKKAKLEIKPESNPNTARPELVNGDDDGDYDDDEDGGGGGYEIAANMQYGLAQEATHSREEEERK